MDVRNQFRAKSDWHERMFNRVIVEGARWKAHHSVGLGVQIGLHGIQAACGAIAVFGPIRLHRHLAQLRQQGTKRGERYRLGAKSPHGSPMADPFRHSICTTSVLQA